MTCLRFRNLEIADFLIEPSAEAWAEFRAHYPACSECSSAVADWTLLTDFVRMAAAGGEETHPPEEALAAFESGPDALSPAALSSIRVHLASCPACRDMMTALAAFGASDLDREVAGRDSPGARSQAPTDVIPSSARHFLGLLEGVFRRPLLAAAVALLAALAGVAWWTWGRDFLQPPDAARSAAGIAATHEVTNQEREPPPGTAAGTPEARHAELPPAADPSREQPLPVIEPHGLGSPERMTQTPETLPAERAPSPIVREDSGGGALNALLPQPVEKPGDAPLGRSELPMVVAMAALGPPSYLPPRGAAGPARVDVRVRGDSDAAPALRALVPDHVGLTQDARPTLHWFASAGTRLPVVFTLIDEDGMDPVLEVDLTPPPRAGIFQVSLADHGIHLQRGITYQWFVSISTRPEEPSHDVVSGGMIRLAELSADRKREIAGVDSARLGHAYAERGLWYDALAFFSRAVAQAPDEERLRSLRASLLEQVGLDDAAKYDRAVAGAG